ncbi:osiris 12 [Sergentomyia squamirostris]
MMRIICGVLLIAVAVAGDQEFLSPGVRAAIRVYDECQRAEGGFSVCLKKKAITFIDRVTKVDAINIGEGVRVVRSADSPAVDVPKTLNEVELDKNLPRTAEARDEALSTMLSDRVARFLSSRTIMVSLPKVSSDELGRSVEEGRGKMKKMMSMMMMGFAMKMAAMIPVAIAGLYLLAGKALIISKIALLLAGIIALKKLLSQKNSGGGGGGGWSSGGGSGGWSSGGGGGGHGGGWDRRSLEAQEIAYRGYVTQ